MGVPAGFLPATFPGMPSLHQERRHELQHRSMISIRESQDKSSINSFKRSRLSAFSSTLHPGDSRVNHALHTSPSGGNLDKMSSPRLSKCDVGDDEHRRVNEKHHKSSSAGLVSFRPYDLPNKPQTKRTPPVTTPTSPQPPLSASMSSTYNTHPHHSAALHCLTPAWYSQLYSSACCPAPPFFPLLGSTASLLYASHAAYSRIAPLTTEPSKDNEVQLRPTVSYAANAGIAHRGVQDRRSDVRSEHEDSSGEGTHDHQVTSSTSTNTMLSNGSVGYPGFPIPSDKAGEPLDLLPRSLYMNKSRKGHLCIYCGKLYSRKYGLKIHLRTHTGYKPLKCKVCLRPFGDPSNLNKHIRLHAEGDTPYRCEYCGKVLVRRRDLERHIKSRHPDKCEVTDQGETDGIEVRHERYLNEHLDIEARSDRMLAEDGAEDLSEDEDNGMIPIRGGLCRTDQGDSFGEDSDSDLDCKEIDVVV